MCVIISCTKKHPSKDDLEACHRQNSDGVGVSWAANGGVFYRKGLTLAEVIEIKPPFPCVYHFRMATVGGKSNKLCHPFVVADRSPVDKVFGFTSKVLFHNGHVSEWETLLMVAGIKMPKGPMSDSRAIALLVEKVGPKVLKRLGQSGKYCLFNQYGAKLYGHWTPHDGCKFSNMFWGGHWTRTTAGELWGEYERERKAVSCVPSKTSNHYGRQVWDDEKGCWVPAPDALKLVEDGNFTPEQAAEIAAAEADEARAIGASVANHDSGSLVESASFPDYEGREERKVNGFSEGCEL